MRADSILPPWVSDHTVLQRTTPATKPADVLLWGWSDKGDTVTVEFVGKTKPIIASLSPAPNRPELRKWTLAYSDLKAGFAPAGPFKMVIVNKARKKTTRLELNNVVAGDVWVFGQKQGRGVVFPSGEKTALAAACQGRLRFLVARSLNWSNMTEAVEGPWHECDPASAAFTNLVNVTCYFGRRLVEQNGEVPVGLVVVPWEGIFQERVDAPEEFNRSPGVAGAWQAALQAGQAAARDCDPILEGFRRDILQLKREGRTLAEPPPLKIEPPTRLHLGGFPSMPLVCRGGIW